MFHFRLDEEAILWVASRLKIDGSDDIYPNFDKLRLDIASKDHDVSEALNDFIQAVKDCVKHIESQIRNNKNFPDNYIILSQRRDQAKVRMEDVVNSYLSK